MTTATDDRKQLKIDICNYFTQSGVSREKLAQICQTIKMIEDEGRMVEDFFSPKHQKAVEGFCRRLRQIESASFVMPDRKMTRSQARAILADPTSSRDLIKEASEALK